MPIAKIWCITHAHMSTLNIPLPVNARSIFWLSKSTFFNKSLSMIHLFTRYFMLNKGTYKELRWLFFIYVFYFEMWWISPTYNTTLLGSFWLSNSTFFNKSLSMIYLFTRYFMLNKGTYKEMRWLFCFYVFYMSRVVHCKLNSSRFEVTKCGDARRVR